MWRSVLKLLVFGVFVTIFFSGSTDADLLVNKTVPSNVWAATTLDFSNKDTANNQETSSLFDVNGLLPEGFQVKSVRIKNEGKMSFSYLLTSEQTGGDQNLYKQLRIKIMKNWVVKYDGAVETMKIQMDEKDMNSDDWIMFLSVYGNDENMVQKETRFNILFKTGSTDPKKGFYVEKKLENRVLMGIWKNG